MNVRLRISDTVLYQDSILQSFFENAILKIVKNQKIRMYSKTSIHLFEKKG